MTEIQEDIKFKVILTLEEYKDLHYTYILHGTNNSKVSMSKRSIAAYILLFSIAFVTTFKMIYNGAFTFEAFYPIFVYYILLLLGLLIIFMPSLKKQFESNKIIQEEYSYVINKDGFNVSTEDINANFSWNKVFNVIKSKISYMIFIGLNEAYVLPKRCFSEGDIERFEVIVKESLSKENVNF